MLLEPSVFWSPYFWSPSACSMVTRAGSAPSSSASSAGIVLRTPWPISERAQTSVTRPSGAMWTKTFGRSPADAAGASALAGASASASALMSTSAQSNAAAKARRPANASARPPTNRRRVIAAAAVMSLHHQLARGALDRRADAAVGAAAAEVAGQRTIDVVVGRLRDPLEQRGRGHDLAGLAEPTLRDPEIAPRSLQRVAAVGRQPLDGGQRAPGGAAHRRHARADRLTVEVDRAGAAQRLAAAVLGADKAQHVAQHPEDRHLGVDVEVVIPAVDAQVDHRLPSGGHSAPASIHAATSWPRRSCVPGAGSRPAPGDQPQPTSGSRALCSAIWASVRRPLRAGS